MSIVRNAIRSSFARRAENPLRSLPFLGEWPRRFSTYGEQPHIPAPGSGQWSPQDAAVNTFMNTANRGTIYRKLLGYSGHVLKTDILNLFEGCNLTQDDIKFHYSNNFAPVGIFVQFPSRSSYDNAVRAVARKGRIYKLEEADPRQWNSLVPYDGKAILLQGIPRNALAEDIERFLSGCDYDQNSIQFSVRQGYPDPIRMALVRFPSQTQAMNAFITKNKSFCLNNQITVRVLQ